MLSKLAVLSAVGVASLASAELPLPEVNPPLNSDYMASYMDANLRLPEYTKTYWDSSMIPQNCKEKAINNYFVDPNDFTVFDVKFDDCETPWTFCRHKDAPNSEDQMIGTVGRQPVRVRQYINLIMAVPQISQEHPGTVAETWTSGECVLGSESSVKVLSHEFTHSVDAHADTDQSKPFSDTDVWHNAYNSDKATPTGYGRTNWAEDFAEIGMFVTYVQAGGKLEDLTTSWADLYSQLITMAYYFPQYEAKGTCEHRLDNAPAVPKSDALAKLKGAKKIDTSIKSDNIKVIKVDFANSTAYAPYHEGKH